MKTLAIDTSNQTLAVAVVDGQEVLGQSQTMAIKNHSTALMPAIDGLMQAVGMAPKELEQIVVAKVLVRIQVCESASQQQKRWRKH